MMYLFQGGANLKYLVYYSSAVICVITSSQSFITQTEYDLDRNAPGADTPTYGNLHTGSVDTYESIVHHTHAVHPKVITALPSAILLRLPSTGISRTSSPP